MARPKRKPHEACRKLVCYKCGNKVRAGLVMTPAKRNLIQMALPGSHDDAYWTEYWKTPKYPLALCETCRTHLRRLKDADFQDPTGVWSKWVHHEDMPPRLSSTLAPESRSDECVCKICRTVHPGGLHQANPYGKVPAKKGRRPVLPSSPVLACPDCGAPVTEDDGHRCKSSNVVDSMSKLAEKDPKAAQMFAANDLIFEGLGGHWSFTDV